MRVHVDTSDPLVLALPRLRSWAAVGCLAGLALGALTVLVAPTTYSASVGVELSPAPVAVDLSPTARPPRLVSVDTDAQLVASDEVTAAVSSATGRDVASVRAGLTVSARPLTRVLQLTYRDSSAATAEQGARVAAETLLAVRERLVLEPVRTYLAAVTEGRGARAVVSLPERVRIVRPVTLGQRERALDAALDLPPAGRVTVGAAAPATPQHGDVEVPLVSGAATGALLGAALGLIRVRRQLPREAAKGPVPS